MLCKACSCYEVLLMTENYGPNFFHTSCSFSAAVESLSGGTSCLQTRLNLPPYKAGYGSVGPSNSVLSVAYVALLNCWRPWQWCRNHEGNQWEKEKGARTEVQRQMEACMMLVHGLHCGKSSFFTAEKSKKICTTCSAQPLFPAPISNIFLHHCLTLRVHITSVNCEVSWDVV